MNPKALAKQFVTIYKKKGILYLLFYLIRAVNDGYIKRYLLGSSSQKGEDLVIEKLIGKKKKGFYLDVGAHNPHRFNNTKRFYGKGWRGINIEPNPILFNQFVKERKRDINLNIGIGKKSGFTVFYELQPDSLSTFSKNEMEAKIRLGYKLQKKYRVKIASLKNILNKYKNQKIDFISVDTEGLDFEVLDSNDWNHFRPTLVCVETANFDQEITGKKNNKKKQIDHLMKIRGYREVFTNGLNTIYKDTKIK